ncbi:MAG: hypothetical protein RL701_6941 [Pseudomonadota bacterium]|jgi:hypothetical protein
MEFDALAPLSTARISGGLVSAQRAQRSQIARSLPPSAPLIGPLGPDEQRPRGPQSPIEVLASMMDFSGSVALADLLHEPGPKGPANPEAAKLARKLQEQLSTRFEALLSLSLRPLTGQRRPPVLKPAELLEEIVSTTGAADRLPDAEAAVKLSRKIGAPLRAALIKSLRDAQGHLAHLRTEIGPELRALGPRADRLERIDAALQRSIANKQVELFERVALAAELSFERACVHACSGLPENFGLSDLASWSGTTGWIERYRERSVQMTEALFGHLQRSIEGLLLAAIHLEVVV